MSTKKYANSQLQKNEPNCQICAWVKRKSVTMECSAQGGASALHVYGTDNCRALFKPIGPTKPEPTGTRIVGEGENLCSCGSSMKRIRFFIWSILICRNPQCGKIKKGIFI